MRTLGIAITVFALGATAGGLAAEAPPEARFERLTMAQGLPENDVLALVQDHLGFLWLGTTNGLVKYDGYTFTSYKPDPADPASLGGRIILDLYEDRAGELWIATRRGGLNRFDRDNDRFVRFTHDPADPRSLSFDAVTAVTEDRSGALWVGTGDIESQDAGGGLNRFDRQSGTFVHYRHDPADPRSLSHDVVSALYQDREGRLWVGTRIGGLNRLDAADPGGGFTRYRHQPQDPASLASDRITAIHQDRRETLWVATDGGGLQRFDPATGGWTRYRHDPADPGSLVSDRVWDLHEDGEGSLWLATCGGVSQYDPDRGSFAPYRHDPGDPASLSDSYCVSAIARDRAGILWFATLGGGLNKLDRSADKFLHLGHDPRNLDSLIDDRVNAVYEDRAGTLWIGTRGGLSSLDPKTGAYTGYRHDADDPGSLGDDWIQALHQDRAGVLWVGTRQGLHRFEPRTRSFQPYRHDPGNPTSLSADFVSAIHEDRHGELWIGTGGGGLNRLDRESGEFTRYRNDDADPGSLSHDWVMTVYEDRQGTLWIGTDGQGLNRFDRHRRHFTSYFSPLEGLDLITALHEDAAGRLWVGTYNGGLHLFDRDSGTSRAFTERHGLAHDTVFAILEDGQGSLWISTGRGLSKFHPGEGRFRNYDASDGLGGRRLSGGACKTQRGELFFGSDDGINVFFPELVEDNLSPPQVVLTDFKIFNRSVVPGPGAAPLSRHISVADEIRLAHHQNVFTIAFAALHYSNPERNRYAFRLDPFDRGWTAAGGRRTATYTNLSPGEYTFRVKAANGDGVWNEEGASLSLTIAPPWWRTWWAWIAYALALAAGVGATDRARRAHLLKEERAKAAQREAVLRAEAAEHQARAAEHQAKAAEAQAVLLQAENDRQTRELEEARQLQLSMLPRTVPWHPEVDIAAAMRTASEVGGDYYDFDLGDDGTLTVALGDATGHGTKAGTVVAAAKSLFHLLAGETEVVRVLQKANRAFKRMSLQNLYMSLAVGKLRGGVLELASAGIPPALLVRAGSRDVEEVGVPGMPLGGPIRFPYRSQRLELAAGDTVVLMSDGLPETLGADDEQLGYERVAAAFAEAAVGSTREIIERLFAAAEEWADGRPQNDDMTLVVLRVK